MDEIHFTKKDFKIDWFSGHGAGGQHRNKHQNCCRITHLKSGLKAQATSSKSRVSNQKDAFMNLAQKIIHHYKDKSSCEINTEVIRNYNPTVALRRWAPGRIKRPCS